jgi:hypothetical protein
MAGTRRDPQTGLLPSEEAFCVSIAKGASQAVAWREAFSHRKLSDDTIYQRCSRLARDPRVQARLHQLREHARELSALSLAEHLANLAQLRDGAVGANQFGPAVSAEVAAGKASGLYTEKVEHTGQVSIIAGRWDADI